MIMRGLWGADHAGAHALPKLTEPSSAAPPNSHMAAMTIACFMVRALAPTEEPNALATSLAPMP